MKNIKVGSKAYVFTSWGLVKGVVVKQRAEHGTGFTQHKLDIDINRENKGKAYNFWYMSNQLNKYYFIACVLEIFKPFGWWVKGVLGR